MAVSCAWIATGSPAETAITGSVLRGGEPATRAYIRLVTPGGEFTSEIWCGPSGGFYLPALPGDWELVCLAPRASRLQQRLTLARGDQVEVNFRLDAA